MHVLLAALSVLLMAISMNAYRTRPVRRYFILMLAFIFLSLDQIVNLYQEVSLGGQLIVVPILELHLDHFLELLMILSFIAALLVSSGESRA